MRTSKTEAGARCRVFLGGDAAGERTRGAETLRETGLRATRQLSSQHLHVPALCFHTVFAEPRVLSEWLQMEIRRPDGHRWAIRTRPTPGLTARWRRLMNALPHLASVVSGLLVSQLGVQVSLLSGLPFVGFFALLLGSGYVLLAHRWLGHRRRPHR